MVGTHPAPMRAPSLHREGLVRAGRAAAAQSCAWPMAEGVTGPRSSHICQQQLVAAMQASPEGPAQPCQSPFFSLLTKLAQASSGLKHTLQPIYSPLKQVSLRLLSFSCKGMLL